MPTRREFLGTLALGACCLPRVLATDTGNRKLPYPPDKLAPLASRLKPVGRILESPGYYVWCNSPIYGPDGRVHVFYSRWPEKLGMGAWITDSEIVRAVAEGPEKPFVQAEVILKGRPGFFDSRTCHNPHIQYVDGKYCLFYMGNSDGTTKTKRIGLATAASLEGPWHRQDKPLLEAGAPGAWDDHCTTNPAFLRHPNGEYWLYYKSWNTAEYEAAPKGTPIRGNRKYGLAVAKRLEGPYVRHSERPVIDFSAQGNNRQLEDAYVWHEDGRFRLLARDMGFYDHDAGLYLESHDGLSWSEPLVAYLGAGYYIDQPPAPKHLRRYGRFERPQLLLRNGHPTHLFTTSQGGSGMTASGFVFRIES